MAAGERDTLRQMLEQANTDKDRLSVELQDRIAQIEDQARMLEEFRSADPGGGDQWRIADLEEENRMLTEERDDLLRQLADASANPPAPDAGAIPSLSQRLQEPPAPAELDASASRDVATIQTIDLYRGRPIRIGNNEIEIELREIANGQALLRINGDARYIRPDRSVSLPTTQGGCIIEIAELSNFIVEMEATCGPRL
jgi:hypothetical protein